jgi:hypothetical protein
MSTWTGTQKPHSRNPTHHPAQCRQQRQKYGTINGGTISVPKISQAAPSEGCSWPGSSSSKHEAGKA